MNIFFLDSDPDLSAKYHNDKHVVKMCCEYAQLLSTAHRVIDGFLWKGHSATGRSVKRYFLKDPYLNSKLYLACHINHPSSIWVRDSIENYEWMYSLFIALGEEYNYRYGKTHKSISELSDLLLLPPQNIRKGSFTEPPPAMKQYPQCIVPNDSVQSYRNYYSEAKRSFCVWTKRQQPSWWNNENL